MSWEPIRVYDATIVSAATLSDVVDLKHYYQRIHLSVPKSYASASDFYVQGCESSTGDFKRIKVPVENSATVAINTFTIASGASNSIVPIPAQGIRYLKIEASTANAKTLEFKLICGG